MIKFKVPSNSNLMKIVIPTYQTMEEKDIERYIRNSNPGYEFMGYSEPNPIPVVGPLYYEAIVKKEK